MTGGLPLLAVLTAALNVPIGQLRAGAGRFSHRRFGLLAASTVLLLAMRHAFALPWSEAWVLLLAMLAGQVGGCFAVCRQREPVPPSPGRWRLAAYTILTGAALLLAGSPAQAAPDKVQGTGQKSGKDWQRLDANEPAPGFTLTDQDGRRVSLAALRGKVVVASFIYTECKDVCPVLPQILSRVDRFLKPEEIARTRFVGISIDPLRDTPEKLRAFMSAHALSPERWTLLTGNAAELTRVAADYGVVAKPDAAGELIHNAVYVVIDGNGKLRTEFHGLFTPSAEIAGAIRALLPTAAPRPRSPRP